MGPWVNEGVIVGVTVGVGVGVSLAPKDGVTVGVVVGVGETFSGIVSPQISNITPLVFGTPPVIIIVLKGKTLFKVKIPPPVDTTGDPRGQVVALTTFPVTSTQQASQVDKFGTPVSVANVNKLP